MTANWSTSSPKSYRTRGSENGSWWTTRPASIGRMRTARGRSPSLQALSRNLQLRTRSDQLEREGLRDGVTGVGGAELAPQGREVARDRALGRLQRLPG